MFIVNVKGEKHAKKEPAVNLLLNVDGDEAVEEVPDKKPKKKKEKKDKKERKKRDKDSGKSKNKKPTEGYEEALGISTPSKEFQ